MVCKILKSTGSILGIFMQARTLTGAWGHRSEGRPPSSCSRLLPTSPQSSSSDRQCRNKRGEATALRYLYLHSEVEPCNVVFCTVVYYNMHAGDPGGGANAKTSQVCSSTPEQENGQCGGKTQGRLLCFFDVVMCLPRPLTHFNALRSRWQLIIAFWRWRLDDIRRPFNPLYSSDLSFLPAASLFIYHEFEQTENIRITFSHFHIFTRPARTE